MGVLSNINQLCTKNTKKIVDLMSNDSLFTSIYYLPTTQCFTLVFNSMESCLWTILFFFAVAVGDNFRQLFLSVSFITLTWSFGVKGFR